ncbi:MAG: hypothetical protein HDS44_03145 [Bacteroides sp.]|nr:hypothetical protein [Bacteroides sp.]MBD5300342.1 hypothetical protein [Bacteroides sp.]
MLISLIMFLCTAPAMEPDMCMLKNAGCECCMAHDCCDDGCDCGCDCCSPFIACMTCSGFEAMRAIRVSTPTTFSQPRIYSAVIASLPTPPISIPTPPPVHC